MTKNTTATKKSPKQNTTATEEDKAMAQQELIQNALKLLTPLTDFQQAVEDATQNDLRIFWDVRIVRGQNTPFCHVHGTSSLPLMLAHNMIALAPSKIEAEIRDKILMPLVSTMQTEAEKSFYANPDGRGKATKFTREEECFSENSFPSEMEQANSLESL